MRRIAARHGLYGASLDEKAIRNSIRQEFLEPLLLANHANVSSRNQIERKLILPIRHVTFVREPIERALSQYYHLQVSRRHKSTSSQAVIQWFKKIGGGEMVSYIRRNRSHDPYVIVGEYDFIGVTERMQESMVVLKHILGLPSLCDVLYLSAKNSSGPPHKDNKGFEFIPHVPFHQQPTEVQQFVASPKNRRKMLPDSRLYAAANAALDRWIHELGTDVVSQQVIQFNELLSKARIQCAGATSLTSDTATCYWNDNGCAYPCLDDICAQRF
eukprot:TRINITY_DN14612_c0_g1_i1.p1 TRINITY_DN14612_c0_g1~~TRINITY_DN14612_c0_g1_i1.p1  ORF type:complete len:272 (+),score=4.13 TRINITY_DN14612_c0_g1_i1:494-1309(+)